ncbi:MAG: type II toxin-antitoxin system RelE/ParE family toxin [Candidatus Edwardsbacteria bacterium]|nr:type II toxin-antitoxin system RelE/ParE family toxin [Candidatus Edwardsbacteria bacterium]MBU2594608.1 type II toxin-antitoxin system RelE/ParE family toxin [Candidatus Edwardsbacteria bacterium]
MPQKWYTSETGKPHVPKIKLKVLFYQNESGIEPVRMWLKSLSKEYRQAIGVDIKTVQLGWPIGMPVVCKIEKYIWEVRTDLKDGIARVLFTTDTGSMILLHGFIKKTRETPDKEKALARRRLAKLRRG